MLVGFSGGLDSTVLLHQLATSVDVGKHDVRAIHVNHGLHPDADAGVLHCQHFCDANAIPLTIIRVNVARNSGDGPEASARKARHAAFEAEMHDDETLVLAHHRDDQAETFLLRALRASGPDGLGAMRAWRAFGRGWLWRPLLDVPRSELLAYARQHGLQWIEDPSNTDTALDRNFLRHRVLPLLRERWAHVDAAFARSASLSAEAGGLLDEEDARALISVGGHDPRTIEVEELLKLPNARRARVLRRWIGNLKLPPLPSQGVNRIENDLLDAAPDASAAFTWSGSVIHRWRNVLHADIQRAPLPADWQVQWDGRHELPLPGGGVLKLSGADRFDAPMNLHARLGGERITLPGRSHSHALKHVLQDMGVPPWQRERLPLLTTQDGELLAAGDLVYSSTFDTWLRARSARLQIVAGGD
ncbi:MAG: tRNA lysidine(34) synthetase TilS [Luteimonas sp.]